LAIDLIWNRSRAFLSRLYGGLYTAGKCGAKKGGIDELEKLRSGAKRNGAILTFLRLRMLRLLRYV
jgi:hypothetical protein